MKKIYATSEYKRRNKRHAEKSLRRKILSKEKSKARRKDLSSVSNDVLQNRSSRKQFERLKAPSNFSFIENTNEVLSFLDQIRDYIYKRKPVLIDLAEITNLSNDAIVLLLAFVRSPSITRGIPIKGTFPKDGKLRKIFQESGVFGSEGTGSESKNYIITRRNKKAEGGIANELIKRSTKEIFGQEARCPGIYRALMESMANTCYHAKPKFIGHETWWLTVYHDKVEKKVSFAFIDLGVGIFKSSNMIGFKDKLKSTLGISDNRDVLKEIISGGRISSTKIPYRGKGLPSIYKGLERNYYSNLKIISNDVKTDLSTNQFEKIPNEFSGTFLYWELNSTNRWIS